MREKVIHSFMRRLREEEKERWRYFLERAWESEGEAHSANPYSSKEGMVFEAARDCTNIEAARPYSSTKTETTVRIAVRTTVLWHVFRGERQHGF